ncbi:class I SAM-dependent methyltransferase [Desulfovibrio mangrovi]|uniref:class I SAM-dependent methyltransferase n=1 Tax=Desulfovibrio mangrovi TaxID=2976983 RepID=UPI002246D012|nr:class I SAM-dependent methyltransferase [Desulfovibrio mangrovi]UZP66167.1 class I SAM-dependent methyltransferase [Desulfovibrio mangrovi]
MHTACSVCGSTAVEELGTIQRRSVTKRGIMTFDMPVAICRDCGFSFLHPTPSDEEFIEIHRNVYYPNWGDNQNVIAHARQVFSKVTQALPLPQDYAVLDIGCGEGNLLEVFHEHGADCTGVEIRDEIDISRLKAQGIAILQQPFQEIRFDRTFDLIIMDNVMEHVPSPSAFLMSAREILAPHGHLVILVPYVSATSDEAFIPEHVNFFTPATLKNLCKASGFEAVEPPHPQKALSIYRKSTDAARKELSNEYRAAAALIREYMSRKDERDALIRNGVQQAIDAYFAQGDSVIFYGAGSYALYMMEHLDLSHEGFLGFVESNPLKVGKPFLGHTVHGIADLSRLQPDAVFICTENAHFINEIKGLIRQTMPAAHCRVFTMHDIRAGAAPD